MIDEIKLLAKVEERVRALGKRVGDHEDLREQIKSLSQKIEVQNGYIDSLLQDKVTLSYRISELSKLVEDRFSKQEEKFVVLLKNLKQIILENQSIENRFETINKSVSYCNLRTNDIKDNVDSQSGRIRIFEEKFTFFNERFKKIETQLYAHEENLKNSSNKIEETNKFSANFFEHLKKQDQSLKNSLSSHESIHGTLLKESRQNCDILEEKISKIQKSLEEKISSIEIPDTSDLVSNDTIKKLQRTIDVLSLDAKNAFQKSSNNEMQTQIISKKVEALQIAIKTYELGNAK